MAEAERLDETVVKLFHQQKYDEALPIAKNSLEILVKALGPSHLRVATSLVNLAEIHLAKKDENQARGRYQEALAILEKETEQNEATTNVLERLAYLRFQKREYDQAARLQERALAIKEGKLPKDDPRIAESLHILANVYQMQRRYKEAETLYLRSVAIKESSYGRSDARTIHAMRDYACLSLRNTPVPHQKNYDVGVSQETKAIRSRATCWLSGLRDNCADDAQKGIKFETVLNGKALHLPKPNYPRGAIQTPKSGRVFVAVLIDEMGKVISAKAVCGGDAALIRTSLEAARGAQFPSTTVNGNPIQVTGIITYNYVVQ